MLTGHILSSVLLKCFKSNSEVVRELMLCDRDGRELDSERR